MSTPNPFSSGSTFGFSTSSSSNSNTVSSSSSASLNIFGSSWQETKSPMFVFGEASTANTASSNLPMIFGSSTSASTGSNSSFTSATTSQPLFENTSPHFNFGAGDMNEAKKHTTSSYEDALDALSSLSLITKRSRADMSSKGDCFDLLSDYSKILDLDDALSKMTIIHVAGTKRKSILRNCGFSTGLFTSPHPIDIRERFCSDGWQGTKSPIFGSAFNSSASSSSVSTAFIFGPASTANTASSNMPMVSGSSTCASTGSSFLFTSPSATTSQPLFGNPSPSFNSGTAASVNNDQTNIGDSMAEDTVQVTAPAVPGFSQQAAAPQPSGFVFSSTATSGGSQFGAIAIPGANPLQFGSQPNLGTPQNALPFQASNSLQFNIGGSFSLGSGGGDKANRRIFKHRRTQRKKSGKHKRKGNIGSRGFLFG